MHLTRSVSLRTLLAVALSGMAVAAVLLSLVIAGREVRRLNYVAADERLTLVVERLETVVSRAAEQRRALLTEIGRDSLLIGALRGADVDTEALAARLNRLRAGSDTGLPLELWDSDGNVVLSDMPAGPAIERSRPRAVPLDTVPSYGAFYQEGEDAYYHSTAPVLDNGELLGWVVQVRSIGSPDAAREIEGLIGQDARVFFYYQGDSVWVTLAGDPVITPMASPPDDETVERVANGERTLVRAREVADIPWMIVVEMSDAVITGGARGFMARMLGAGVLLILAAMVAAVLLSQRLTRGLRRLADATDRVAAGDYAARVEPDAGSEEMDRVAAAFNSMASQVATSHDELETRLREARMLTEELSEANVRAEDARLRAESADRAKSDFLATMSHEIRTPINAVLGFCQVLELETLPDGQRREYLQRMQRAARQLASLVEDVLDLSKIQSGTVNIRPANAPVRAVVDAVHTLLDDDIRRKGLAVTVDVASDIIALADPDRLDQILLNLVSNAVKFTPAGGSITIRGERHDEVDAPTVAIVVEDTGIGVPLEKLDAIFDPFVQADTGYTREYGGTGLGLSISRRLARLMDGDLIAESRPGGGSRFTLRLPAAAAVPTA